MKVLLDTHVWLWYLLADSRLPKRHRAIIEDDQSALWLSPVSVWEAHFLIESGRLPVDAPAEDWINHALSTLSVTEARLTFAVALRSRAINLPHQDPADRFIAATAAEMTIPLLTVDRRLRQCGAVVCV